MEKKTYIRPALKSADVELNNIVAASPDIPGESGEIGESGGINSKVWKYMDDNSAKARPDDEEEEPF